MSQSKPPEFVAATTTRNLLTRDIDTFVKTYISLHDKAEKARATDIALMADTHIQVAALCAAFVDKHRQHVAQADVEFIRMEIVTRCLIALNARAMRLSGFGDLAIALGSKYRLENDLKIARKRAIRGTAAADGGGSIDDAAADDLNPRDGRGLYEFTSYDNLLQERIELIGYEEQRADIVNAYHIIEDAAPSIILAYADPTRARTTKQGTNVILYGPPGTGKTVTAKRIAVDLGLNFVFTNTENLLSAFRSETEKNLRNLYARMRRLISVTRRNVLLLLDEADGLVKSRSTTRDLSSADHRLLSRFLTILEPNDGSDNFGIVSVFTTNYLSGIDEAFRRRCKTIFFGFMNDASRYELARRLLDDCVEENEDLQQGALSLARDHDDWVPADFVRFKKDVVTPKRIQLYTGSLHPPPSSSSTTTATDAGGLSVQRVLHIRLPKLKYHDIILLAHNFRPATSRERFNRYLEMAKDGASNE